MSTQSYDDLLSGKLRQVLFLFLLLNAAMASYILVNPMRPNPPYTLPGLGVLFLCLIMAPSPFLHRGHDQLKLNLCALLIGILWASHIIIKSGRGYPDEHAFLLLNLFTIFLISAITLSDNFLAFCLSTLPVTLVAIHLDSTDNLSRIMFVVMLPMVAFLLNHLLNRYRERSTRSLVTRLERERERYNDLSMQDPLTGLLNRRGLEDKFRSAAILSSEQHPHYIAMIDIDHFKSFNDHHGHPQGDYALKMIAGTIGDALRPRDLAVRYGGEEFLIILCDASESLALQLCEHIRQHVELLEIDDRAHPGATCRVTLSAGLAALHRDDLDGTITRADAALYQAKRLGRNRIMLAEAPTVSEAKATTG